MEICCEVTTPKNVGIKISQSYFSKNCVYLNFNKFMPRFAQKKQQLK